MLNKLRERIQQRTMDEVKSEMRELAANGDQVSYLGEYIDYLKALKAGGSTAVEALKADGKKFSRRKVQVTAATIAMIFKKAERSEEPNNALTMARMAYINASGHDPDEKSFCIPEHGPAADKRRSAAAEEWDKFAVTDPNRLCHLAIFPKTPPMTKMEHVQGIGSLIFLIGVAVVAYYYWWGK